MASAVDVEMAGTSDGRLAAQIARRIETDVMRRGWRSVSRWGRSTRSASTTGSAAR